VTQIVERVARRGIGTVLLQHEKFVGHIEATTCPIPSHSPTFFRNRNRKIIFRFPWRKGCQGQVTITFMPLELIPRRAMGIERLL
jgi:hypothetical protein